MKNPVLALGAGLFTGLMASTLPAAAGIFAYRAATGQDTGQEYPPPEMAIEVAAWAFGAFVAAHVTQRISGGMTSVTAVLLGAMLYVVNGIYFLPLEMSPAFWLGGAFACIAGSVAGAVWTRAYDARARNPSP